MPVGDWRQCGAVFFASGGAAGGVVFPILAVDCREDVPAPPRPVARITYRIGLEISANLYQLLEEIPEGTG